MEFYSEFQIICCDDVEEWRQENKSFKDTSKCIQLEAPSGYTKENDVKVNYGRNLIHPSFYIHFSTEELDYWLLDKEGILEEEPSTSTEAVVKETQVAVQVTQATVQGIQETVQGIQETDSTCQKQKDHSSNVIQSTSKLLKDDKTISSEKKNINHIKGKKVPVPSSGQVKTKSSAGKEEVPKKKRASSKVKRERLSDDDKEDIQKKKKDTSKVKRERLSDDYLSDDDREDIQKKKKATSKVKRERLSDRSPHYSRRESRDPRSISEEGYSDEEWEDEWPMRNYNENPFNVNAPGTYYCKCCNSNMNSLATYENHLRGKRHIKNSQMQTPMEKAMKSIQVNANGTRYPPVTPNCRRVVTNETPFIQSLVDSIREPCLGLNNVVEIRLPTEYIYYCRLCDSPCSPSSILPHLKGFRHLLHSLSLYNPEKFTEYRCSKKSSIEKDLLCVLLEYEKKYGRSSLTVERDIPISGPVGYSGSCPGPSWWNPAVSDEKYAMESMETTQSSLDIIPDTSKSDFYCRTCDAHMNNTNMWESHVRGKRHQKNIKKAPGELPSKTKYIKCESTPSHLDSVLRETDEIIVGLDFIRETHSDGGEIYNCFLCGACCTPLDIIDHLMLPKHKLKFLENVQCNELGPLRDLDVPQSCRNQIIDGVASRWEADHGRGKVDVYIKASAFQKY